ncbi:hypothetical protein IscW_ISCW007780 [Ixodes scapularis]|uniref:Uncharacterized protein n=1 Tax=Ixodes scapularis TaxID=6945 RepID=B7PV66_IXOSC|nr:hypothetical protein IscW_ISCW007780 [Ixodes scapularis]|eukprot:XP_002407485.1 hypothetical protein IscW_ISCW007780 [Ixodes scapularis]
MAVLSSNCLLSPVKRSGCGLCRSKTFRRLLIEHRGDIGFATIVAGCVSASECGQSEVLLRRATETLA